FEQVHARVLGALLDAVSAASRELPNVQLPSTPRMADFVHWCCAAWRGMGWDEGMFLEAYEANREEAATTALDSSILPDPLRAFLQEKGLPWQGTSTALLDGLNHHAPEHTRKKKGWPKSARHLSGMLRRLATVLRANGMHFEFFREDGGDRHRLVR